MSKPTIVKFESLDNMELIYQIHVPKIWVFNTRHYKFKLALWLMRLIPWGSPEQVMLKDCPFCFCEVNCFEIPDSRYTKNGTCWVIECKNMGCILPRCGFYGSIDDLINKWNERKHF